MKNFEQFITDIKVNVKLRDNFRASMNKLRTEEKLTIFKAVQRVANELGYEISEEEAKNFQTYVNNRNQENKRMLSDEELQQVSAGCTYANTSYNCYCTTYYI